MRFIMLLFCVVYYSGFVLVHAQNPVANFEVIVTYECAKAVTEYKNYSTNADSFYWNAYGGTEEDIVKAFTPKGTNYSRAKTWNVTLIAFGNNTSDTLSKQVEIKQPRVIYDTIIEDPERFAPLTVEFITDSYIQEGDTIAYFWEFGDGNISHAENPVHVYEQPGYYLVQLHVTKNEDCEYTNMDYITIRDTAQKNEFEYFTHKCNIETPCDDSKEHLIETDDFLLNTVFKRNDSLFVSGIIYQNCCTKKTATFSNENDTINLKLWETGPTCTCWSYYYFEINIPSTEKEEIILTFNGYTVTSTITSNVTKLFENKPLDVYPNPLGDVLHIKSLNNTATKMNYQILDIQGRIIKQGLLESEQGISVGNLKPGIYLLQMSNKTHSYSSRFIKK